MRQYNIPSSLRLFLLQGQKKIFCWHCPQFLIKQSINNQSWIFKSSQFLLLVRFGVPVCVHAKCANRSNRCRNIAIFGFFMMAATAILNFLHFRFVTVRTVKRANLRHRAKSRRNCSNCGWDRRVFDFPKIAAVRHLGFVIRVLGTWDHPWRAFGGLYHCAKFDWNRCSIGL